jgi:hypothetical protein
MRVTQTGRKKMDKTYKMTAINGTNCEEITIEQIKKAGFEVEEARRDGVYDVYADTKKIGTLYERGC